jgi:hypothetical protein
MQSRRHVPDMSDVAPEEVAAFVAELALDLEAMAESARLTGVAACLRGAVVEARRMEQAGADGLKAPRKPARPAA